MNVLINPGADIPDPEEDAGWTNTYSEALRIAREWLTKMEAEGLADIVLNKGTVLPSEEGRWTFTFRHIVTGAEVALETHGIAPLDAYRKEYVFEPRQFWNGSGSADPCLEDFAAEGFVQTYRRVTG